MNRDISSLSGPSNVELARQNPSSFVSFLRQQHALLDQGTDSFACFIENLDRTWLKELFANIQNPSDKVFIESLLKQKTVSTLKQRADAIIHQVTGNAETPEGIIKLKNALKLYQIACKIIKNRQQDPREIEEKILEIKKAIFFLKVPCDLTAISSSQENQKKIHEIISQCGIEKDFFGSLFKAVQNIDQADLLFAKHFLSASFYESIEKPFLAAKSYLELAKQNSTSSIICLQNSPYASKALYETP